MESLEDLGSKLSIYKSQLEQVNQLLEVEPTNEQFLNLKDDLEKVISLTETLLTQYNLTSVASSSATAPQHAPVTAGKESGAVKVSTVENDDDDEDERYSLGDLEAEVEEEEDKAIAKVLLTPPTGPLKVNDHVEVTGGERSFAGIITEKINATEFKIRYYEFPDDQVSLPISSLVRIPPGPFNLSYDVVHNPHLPLGSKCQCKFASDQNYYDVTIAGKTEHGYIITYDSYGTSEEVPLEYLRPLPKLSLQKSSSQSNLTAANLAGPAAGINDNTNQAKPIGKTGGGAGQSSEKKSNIIPIPASLEILPTDTEEEKQRKRKKIKAIKNKNRIIEQEEDVAHVQQSWKKFVDKGIKRSLSGITKSSMFASSDANTSKVGVINSGKNMTQFETRKKYKFDYDN